MLTCTTKGTAPSPPNVLPGVWWPDRRERSSVADTSYGYTANCRYIDGYQRIDIGVVQEWLADFGLVQS